MPLANLSKLSKKLNLNPASVNFEQDIVSTSINYTLIESYDKVTCARHEFCTLDNNNLEQ